MEAKAARRVNEDQNVCQQEKLIFIYCGLIRELSQSKDIVVVLDRYLNWLNFKFKIDKSIQTTTPELTQATVYQRLTASRKSHSSKCRLTCLDFRP